MSIRRIGGVHIRHSLPVVPIASPLRLPVPEKLAIPLNMSIGAPSAPSVSAGEYVFRGQKIAEAKGAVSANVHSPVSGRVCGVEARLTSRGTMASHIIIENDGLFTLDREIRPHPECEDDPDAISALVRECGIVGMGGAAFPTAAKIDSAKGKIDTVLINGAECEPSVISDYYAMTEKSGALLHGISLLLKATGAERAVLAIEENKPLAIEKLRPMLDGNSRITLRILPEVYPQGGEKQLIFNILGREIPSGKLPADVGCAVFNAETTIAVAEAVETGMPLIERLCTVGGGAAKEPKLVIAPVGASVGDILRLSGGVSGDVRKILMGGPMMGTAVYDLEISFTKATNGILALTKKESRGFESGSCIRCGRCVEACPMGLMPNYLYMFTRKNAVEKLREYHINDCLDCGSCSYGCPARLPLNETFRLGKTKLRAYDAAQKVRAEKEAAKP